jgi:lipopolysaccharide transport system ATP-binding protein
MTEPAILVEGLGKRFRVGRVAQRHNTLRDAMAAAASSTVRLVRSAHSRPREDPDVDHIWALRGIDFSVAAGEAIGVVGPNGAGKSTLLKILARITEPTEGRAEIRGRIGSLLEVGTGFHSELTGRENTYLSGAILGMRRAEIDRKFDEIVAFAEIDRFIDTPVKHYSSGMGLRLAFAVAAHLEPEILIIDEVLAVGDAKFQKKCLGKMEEVTHREGRTVFFVSHNMTTVQSLCDRCMLLRSGRIVQSGAPNDVVRSYLSGGTYDSLPENWIDLRGLVHRGNGSCRLSRLLYTGGDASTAFSPIRGGRLRIALRIDADAPTDIGQVSIRLHDLNGTALISAGAPANRQVLPLKAGPNEVEVIVASLHLNPGLYKLGLRLVDRAGAMLDDVSSAAELEVVAPPGGRPAHPREEGPVPCDLEVRLVT